MAITLTAILALMSWRAIDGMSRSQTLLQDRSNALLRIQGGLDQWQADLDALAQTGELDALRFDGRVLLLTRRDSAEFGIDSPGVRVVAWTRHDGLDDATRGQWARWQSPPLQQREQLARAWTAAIKWGNGDRDSGDGERMEGQSIALFGIDDWQIYYHRGDGWSNPQSDAEMDDAPSAAAGAGGNQIPNGVRLVLDVAEGQGVSGKITRDWVRPTLEAGR
ncbi:hypothetical protein NBRC116584_31160 [Hydrogenophaga sp. 5NK40-0174]